MPEIIPNIIAYKTLHLLTTAELGEVMLTGQFLEPIGVAFPPGEGRKHWKVRVYKEPFLRECERMGVDVAWTGGRNDVGITG